MTPEVFEGVRWVLILLLGYFILPLKKKVEKNQCKIAKIDKAQAVRDANYEHIKESLDKIELYLKEINGRVKP